MGHLSNPDIPALLAPRSPILLKHRCTCLDFKRNTTMINIKDIGISGINLFHIFGRLAVLNLIIHMKYT
jgi:hypothetical protein